MTGRQVGVLAILAVLLLLVVLVALLLVSGRLNQSLAQATPTEIFTSTSGEAGGTSEPGVPVQQTPLSTSSPPSFQDTEMPGALSTVHTSTPATQIATLTHTLTPPTDICTMLDLRFLSATSNIAAWRLQNDSGTTLTVTRIEIDWPKSNDAIFNAFLDGKVVWSDEDLTPPTTMTTWIGDPEDRRVDGLTRVELFFGTMAAYVGYDLHLWFENGCEVSAAN